MHLRQGPRAGSWGAVLLGLLWVPCSLLMFFPLGLLAMVWSQFCSKIFS